MIGLLLRIGDSGVVVPPITPPATESASGGWIDRRPSIRDYDYIGRLPTVLRRGAQKLPRKKTKRPKPLTDLQKVAEAAPPIAVEDIDAAAPEYLGTLEAVARAQRALYRDTSILIQIEEAIERAIERKREEDEEQEDVSFIMRMLAKYVRSYQ